MPHVEVQLIKNNNTCCAIIVDGEANYIMPHAFAEFERTVEDLAADNEGLRAMSLQTSTEEIPIDDDYADAEEFDR